MTGKTSIDKALKLSISAGIIIIAVSVFYYFVFYLPKSQGNQESSTAIKPTTTGGFERIKTFSRDNCSPTTFGGDEIYTDWFTTKTDRWRIKLTSKIADSREDFSNVRIWYTTSGENMGVENSSAYNEVGSGEPNYGEWSKNDTYNVNYGPGTFRLRIMCWNANFQIEVEDSTN